MRKYKPSNELQSTNSNTSYQQIIPKYFQASYFPGDSLGVNSYIINALEARPAQRSMPSTAWLMPYDTHWRPEEVLVMQPARNYTVKDYDQLFKDIGFVDGIGLRKNTEFLNKVCLIAGCCVLSSVPLFQLFFCGCYCRYCFFCCSWCYCRSSCYCCNFC